MDEYSFTSNLAHLLKDYFLSSSMGKKDLIKKSRISAFNSIAYLSKDCVIRDSMMFGVIV